MSETVRLADVAESIVQRYLFGVVSRLVDSDLPDDAWFRVIAHKSSLELEKDNHTIDPVFEVLLVMPHVVTGLAGVLAEVASTIPGRIQIMPRAAMADAFSKEFLVTGGWTQIAVPMMRGHTPELSLA